MLSRRNIRTKLLQILYSYEVDDSITPNKLKRIYGDQIQTSYDLMLGILLSIEKIALYASKDLQNRKEKYIQDSEDRFFRDHMATNPVTMILVESAYKKEIRKSFEDAFTEDLIRSQYRAYAKTDEYKKYSVLEEPNDSDHLDNLLNLLKFLFRSEDYIESVHDHFYTVDEDYSLLLGALKRVIKKLPEESNHYKKLYPDDDTIKDFGQELLTIYIDQKESLDVEVKKYLRNWELSRIAILDRIVLKMALIEFLNFPQIPIKVTLNEYLDLAKEFSTKKSGEFVNGVLDNMKNKLIKEGNMNKQGRGLIN